MRWGKPPKDLTAWHGWFAWHPVTMPDGTRVWLESIARRCTYEFDGLGAERKWHYSNWDPE